MKEFVAKEQIVRGSFGLPAPFPEAACSFMLMEAALPFFKDTHTQ